MPDTLAPAARAAAAAEGFPAAADLILSELGAAVAAVDRAALQNAVSLLLGAERIFAGGAGRSRRTTPTSSSRRWPRRRGSGWSCEPLRAGHA